MRFTKLLILFLLCSRPGLGWTKNHLFFFGGGGEPQGKGTIFDEQISPLAQATRRGWEVTVAFDGGHSATESLLKKNFGSARSFTKQNLEESLQRYERMLQAGEIGRGDQLFLYLSSHGAPGELWERSHSVSLAGGTVTNFNTGAGAESVSLDRLERIIELARQKGVRLALYDGSCHSGHTLALQHPDVCIVTATGPRNFAHAGRDTFVRRFPQALAPGISLEEAFLRARRESSERDFPMISSATGLELNELLYERVASYLFYYRKNPLEDKFSPFVETRAGDAGAFRCQDQLEHRALRELLGSVGEVLGAENFPEREAHDFLRALEDYQRFVARLTEEFAALRIPAEIQHQEFCTPLETGDEADCMRFTVDELFALDFRSLAGVFRELEKSENPGTRARARAKLQSLEKAQRRIRELLAQYPQLKRQKNFFSSYGRLEAQTREHAKRVADSSARLYDALYRQRRALDPRPGPCDEFKL